MHQVLIIRYQLLGINYKLSSSSITNQLSRMNYWSSIIDDQLLIFDYQLSCNKYQLSSINYQVLKIENQSSIINYPI